MEFSISLEPPEVFACDAIGVGIFADGGALEGPAARIDKALGGLLSAVLAEEKFEGKPGRTLVVQTHGRIPSRRVIAAGLGPKTTATLDHLRQAAAAVVRQAGQIYAVHAALPATTLGALPVDAITQARVEGAALGDYRFARYKRDEGGRVSRVTLLASEPAQQKAIDDGLARGRVFADATMLARDLVNEPPNQLPPVRLAEIAADAARRAGLRCSVRWAWVRFSPSVREATSPRGRSSSSTRPQRLNVSWLWSARVCAMTAGGSTSRHRILNG